MNKLNKGEFYGHHYQKLILEDFNISDTEYTHAKVDWHDHENPYFTYLLQGRLFEANKKTSYSLSPGSLLFHHWQDAHYNLKAEEYTRGFHIEINPAWFKKHDIHQLVSEGSIFLQNPLITGAFNRAVVETKLNDNYSAQSLEMLMLDVFGQLQHTRARSTDRVPGWIKTLQEILREEEPDYTLSNLSKLLDIHPVHLSRSFHQYFKVTLGEYMRHLRLNKAIKLIGNKQFNMTEICYQCGFYDQSHFIKTFKRIYRITPSEYSTIFNRC